MGAVAGLATKPPPLPEPRFLAALAGVLAVLTLAGLLAGGLLPMKVAPTSCPASPPSVADPATPIRHLFVIIQENHAFENYFGDYPGVIGSPPNGSFPTTYGGSSVASPFPLNTSSTPDLPHDRASAIADWDHGKNDMFVAQAAATGAASPLDALAYYTNATVGGYWQLADRYGLGDRFFSGVLGPTQPNRLFDITGFAGDGWYADSSPPANVTVVPTVLGQLTANGIPWAYDYAGLPVYLAPLWFPALVGDPCSSTRILPVIGLGAQLSASDAPSVVFIDISNDQILSEHPPANVSQGESWVLHTVAMIQSSPVGPSSAVLLFYDENGGYWDPIPPPTTSTGIDGFRVPFLVVSPWTPSGTVCPTTLDPSAVLRFIDTNWGLPALNARIAAAGDLGCFFHFPPAGHASTGPRHTGPGAGSGAGPVGGLAPAPPSLASWEAGTSEPASPRTPESLRAAPVPPPARPSPVARGASASRGSC
jgi:phospholipase C